jgi:hypothetical protein
MSNAVRTTVTKSITQPGMAPVSSSSTILGIQNPPLETTVPVATPLTINDGIGVLGHAALQMLYVLSDELDATVELYSATAAGGDLINTINLVAGAAFEWDLNSGANPLGLSIVITVLATAGGVASDLTASDIHARTSLSA